MNKKEYEVHVAVEVGACVVLYLVVLLQVQMELDAVAFPLVIGKEA